MRAGNQSPFPPSVRAYVRQSTFTTPGRHAPHFEGLPNDLRGLSKVVQGLVVHYRNRELRSAHVPKRRLREVNIRYVDRMLDRLLELDPRPLAEPRPLNRRIVGCCRDFATLFTSMARHKGIPARIRVGFANYFAFFPRSCWIDHTIAEFWDSRRGTWRLADPEQGPALVRENRITFDPTDVPWGRFLTGGDAWTMCREGGGNPDDFCVEPESEPRGLWFVRSRLLLDLAALNQEELLLWDSWGATAPNLRLTKRGLGSLDRLAQATSRRPPPRATLARFYRRKQWRHPAEVNCFSPVCRPYAERLRS